MNKNYGFPTKYDMKQREWGKFQKDTPDLAVQWGVSESALEELWPGGEQQKRFKVAAHRRSARDHARAVAAELEPNENPVALHAVFEDLHGRSAEEALKVSPPAISLSY